MLCKSYRLKGLKWPINVVVQIVMMIKMNREVRAAAFQIIIMIKLSRQVRVVVLQRQLQKLLITNSTCCSGGSISQVENYLMQCNVNLRIEIIKGSLS